MKKANILCVILYIIGFLINTIDSAAETDAAVSKKWKEIASEVTQIDGGENSIVYKKRKNAYVLTHELFGCLGSDKEEFEETGIMIISQIGTGVNNIYGTGTINAFTQGNNVYFCGNGYYGTFYKYFNDYYMPKLYPKKVENIWASSGTLAYGVQNNIYLSGLVVNGRLVTPRKKPQCILKNNLNQVKSISMSLNFAIVHYKNGKAEIMGEDNNNKCVQDKTNNEGGYFYKNLVPLNQYSGGVKKYIAGDCTIGAIKKNGDFYIWGSNEQGFLCKKSLKTVTHKPQLVLKNVKDVSMKYGHVLALKKNGTVWAWGKSYQENGFIYVRNKKRSFAINNSKGIVTKPVKIASNVKKITTGQDFSVILKTNGVAYWKGTINNPW